MQRSRERHVRGGREQTGDARRPGGTIVVQLCRGAGHRGGCARTRRGYQSAECVKEPELESMTGSVSLVKRSGSALTYAVDGQRWRGSPRSSLSVRPFGPAVQHPEGGSQLAEIETAGSVKKHRRSFYLHVKPRCAANKLPIPEGMTLSRVGGNADVFSISVT